jgi:ATP-dependent Lhr-like helicase
MAMDAAGELEFLTLPASCDFALSSLPEPFRRWFVQHVGSPTVAQRLAWPALACGKNVLLSAPTGSGKTLAAFLPILGRIVSEPAGRGIRCLYVSPLKALTSDVRRNLRLHLRGLRTHLPDCSRRIRIGLRTGDTPARLRQELGLRPPDFLLTTPESLAILLSLPTAPALLAGVNTVVIDEVHALADNKRGADLALSLERLVEIVGDFQRIGLSATCAPLEEAARFLVGVSRPCIVAQALVPSPLQLDVEQLEEGGTFFTRLLNRLYTELARNRSTLIFTNTRRLAERLAFALRRRHPAWDKEIAVHHSALAAARRRDVERRFKHGRLRAVVCSTSLELGIDIGPADSVVLVHPPGAVVRLLQRIGRSGHAPGRLRRGLVVTAGPSALFEAAVTAASSHAAQCEPLRVPEHPLDVLCQQLIGMAAAQPFTADDTYQLVRRAYPFRQLCREDFDDCLAYLSGHGLKGGRLPVRLRQQDHRWTVNDKWTAALLRRNVGSIIEEDTLRVAIKAPIENQESKIKNQEWIGEVDTAFGDALEAGDRFLLDGRCLEFRRRAADVLIVDEVFGRPAAPHWHGSGWPLAAELARRLYLLRAHAAESLRDGHRTFMESMQRELGMAGEAADSLARHFERQEAVSEVPDARTLLIEAVRRDHGTEHYLHTPLNRPGNDAIARISVLRLARDLDLSALSMIADLGLLVVVRGRHPLGPDLWRMVLRPERFEADLETALADSDLLGERFRQAAQTGLLWPRNPIRSHSSWAGRDRRTTFDPEFVLLRQARREVVAEMREACSFLEQLSRLTICCRPLVEISPFVAGWNRVEAGPMETVERRDKLVLAETG